MVKKIPIRLLFVLFVLMCCSSSLKAQEILYPTLKLDIGRSKDAAVTEPTFTAFVLADSGSEVDGIKIELAGNLDARDRGTAGIPLALLYRDFIFEKWGQNVTVTLSGLNPNQDYEISIYSYDLNSTSGGTRIADWTANSDFIFQAAMDGTRSVSTEDSFVFRGWTQSDTAGRIVLEGAPAADTPENEPFAFLNGLTVYSTIPVSRALRPVPANGSTITTDTVELQWKAAELAVKHDVYIGTSLADVNNATPSNAAIYQGRIDPNNYTATDLLPGNTYYWRIDEVKADGSVTKGYIWNFLVASLIAYDPRPVDTSLFADPNATLSWSAGAGATSHHVYFGDNLQDVQAGTGGTDKGSVTEPNYAPPGPLEREKTYYWRIDEFDGVNTHTGDVWSFTTTLEGLGTIDMDIWEDLAADATLNILTEDPRYPDNPTRTDKLTSFSTVNGVGSSYGGRIHGWLYVPLTGDYTFYFTSAGEGELWLSTDDEPENVQLLTAERVWGDYNLFSHKSDPVPLIGGNRYYIRAIWKDYVNWDHCRAAWIGAGVPGIPSNPPVIAGNYLSPYEPVSATAPRPRDGSTNVSQKPILSWKSGKYAASHNVYFGSDPNTLSQVATNPAGQEQYGPIIPALDPNQTYYWRIDEVNDARAGGPWVGKVWSFTTAPYLVVDDFEYYDDVNNLIYLTWEDCYANNNNTGMTVGYFVPPYAERTIINRGSQAMYLRYDNDGTVNEGVVIEGYNYEKSGTLLYSEAQRTWAEPQDWTVKDANSLSLWFRGIPPTYGSFVAGPPTWTLTARGTDIVGTADSFFFAHKLMSGNGIITARVDSLTETDAIAKAGVMIRESLTPGSRYVMIAISPTQGVYFQNRITDGAGADQIQQTLIAAPQWLRLTRTANTFTAEYSATGNPPWTQVDTGSTVDMPMNFDTYVGLCVTSRNVNQTCTANFSEVSLPATATGEWSYGDIGIQSNIAEQLYVVLTDSAGISSPAVTYPDATIIDVWTPWNIPLTSFTGVNMQAITKLSIGVGDRANPQLGSAGDLYIDDIGLQLPDSGQ
jgi:hypothetical protein